MPVLRGHHLICLHFYRGQGYSGEFVKNLNRILQRLSEEDVLVVEGPDDVCKMCPFLYNKRCKHTADSENEIRRMDNLALRVLNVTSGDTISWQRIRQRLPLIMRRWVEQCCKDCTWRAHCMQNEMYRRLLFSI